MSRNWSYTSGQHNAICDSCGRKFKSAELRKRWDGFIVCEDDWEPRQTLDFVRSRADRQTPPWIRPQLPMVFVPVNYTEFPYDPMFVSESISTAADFYRYIGQITYPTDVDVVNGSIINLLIINSNSTDSTPPTNDEMFSLSESVVTSRGITQILSDSFTLSESLSETESEFTSDSMTFSESVVAFTITNRLLNSHQLNEVLLG